MTFMKQRLVMMAVAAFATATMMAGGLMTNTNYHIAFDRMMARGATFDIDAAYSNPAGLAWGTRVSNSHSTFRNLGNIVISR